MNRPAQAPQLRGKLWVELAGHPAMTEAGADLLSQIVACGSLSEAARQLRFSYRRAWVLVDTMNRRWSTPLVTTAIGGKNGGGATLTPRGFAVLSAYRDLQLKLEALLDQEASSFDRSTR